MNSPLGKLSSWKQFLTQILLTLVQVQLIPSHPGAGNKKVYVYWNFLNLNTIYNTVDVYSSYTLWHTLCRTKRLNRKQPKPKFCFLSRFLSLLSLFFLVNFPTLERIFGRLVFRARILFVRNPKILKSANKNQNKPVPGQVLPFFIETKSLSLHISKT